MKLSNMVGNSPDRSKKTSLCSRKEKVKEYTDRRNSSKMWTADVMRLAVDAVTEKRLTIGKASEVFRIPKSILRNRILQANRENRHLKFDRSILKKLFRLASAKKNYELLNALKQGSVGTKEAAKLITILCEYLPEELELSDSGEEQHGERVEFGVKYGTDENDKHEGEKICSEKTKSEDEEETGEEEEEAVEQIVEEMEEEVEREMEERVEEEVEEDDFEDLSLEEELKATVDDSKCRGKVQQMEDDDSDRHDEGHDDWKVSIHSGYNYRNVIPQEEDTLTSKTRERPRWAVFDMTQAVDAVKEDNKSLGLTDARYGETKSTLHGVPKSTLHSEPKSTLHSEPKSTLHGEPKSTLHGEPRFTLHGVSGNSVMRKKRQEGKIRNWSVFNMQRAVDFVKEDGASLGYASRRFDVPKSSLYNVVSGRTELGSKPVQKPLLSAEEERSLVGWLVTMSKLGLKLSKQDIINTVKRMLDKEGKQLPNLDDNVLRKDWLYGFMHRHQLVGYLKFPQKPKWPNTDNIEQEAKEIEDPFKSCPFQQKYKDKYVDEIDNMLVNSKPKIAHVSKKSPSMLSDTSIFRKEATVRLCTKQIDNDKYDNGDLTAKPNPNLQNSLFKDFLTSLADKTDDAKPKIPRDDSIIQETSSTKLLGDDMGHHKWNILNMRQAVAAVKEDKVSLGKASKKYGIPKTTLHTAVKTGKIDIGRKSGKKFLSDEEEKGLVRWLVMSHRMGREISRTLVTETVKNILDKQGIILRKNEDNMPGKDWWYGFLRRHEEVADLLIKRKPKRNGNEWDIEYYELGATDNQSTPQEKMHMKRPTNPEDVTISETTTEAKKPRFEDFVGFEEDACVTCGSNLYNSGTQEALVCCGVTDEERRSC